MCPTCRARLNCSTFTGDGSVPVPKPGDLTVCGYCLETLEFFDDKGSLSLRLFDESSLPPDEQREVEEARDLVTHVMAADTDRLDA
jgi:hypothetical protein